MLKAVVRNNVASGRVMCEAAAGGPPLLRRKRSPTRVGRPDQGPGVRAGRCQTRPAVIGVVGSACTVFQWRASGFRPKIDALLSITGDSLRLEIDHRGRGSGLIHHVAVVDEQGLDVKTLFRGFRDSAYVPTTVPAFARMELTLEPPEGAEYTVVHRVLVAWSRHKRVLKVLPVDVSFYGLQPFLPTGDARP